MTHSTPMKRILNTGCLGSTGANLVDRLISTSEVTVLDDLSSGRLSSVGQHMANPKFKLFEGSVLDQLKTNEEVAGAR